MKSLEPFADLLAHMAFSSPTVAAVSVGKANGSFKLPNGPRYARLVRLRAEWDVPETQAPYLVIYSDNYFDLMPGEAKELSLELRLTAGTSKRVLGRLIVEGSNVAASNIPITLTSR